MVNCDTWPSLSTDIDSVGLRVIGTDTVDAYDTWTDSVTLRCQKKKIGLFKEMLCLLALMTRERTVVSLRVTGADSAHSIDFNS